MARFYKRHRLLRVICANWSGLFGGFVVCNEFAINIMDKMIPDFQHMRARLAIRLMTDDHETIVKVAGGRG